MDNSDRDSSWSWEDDDEWQEFRDAFGDGDLATEIISMKHNDPEVISLYLDDIDGWVHIPTRLGIIIGENEYVESVILISCNLPTWTWLGRALS